MTKIWLTAFALSASAAVDSPTPPVRVPPPVVAPAEPDQYARFVRASATLPDLPGWTADLLVSGDEAAVRVRQGSDRNIYPLNTLSTVLMVLADRRLEPLWPAIIAWAGPDLSSLRDRRITAARDKIAAGGTLEARGVAASTSRPGIRAVIALCDDLMEAGRWDEAISTVLAARGAQPGPDDWGQVEWSALTVRLSAYVQRRDGPDAAVGLLEAGSAKLGRDNPYSLNMDVTRAAILAESGHYAAALPLIVSSLAAYEKQQGGEEGEGREKVPGSDRQFVWIRACALRGLGRAAEAESAEAFLNAAEEPSDDFFVMSPNIALRYRYARCIRDVTRTADELVTDFRRRSAGGVIFLTMQPGSPRDPMIDPDFAARVARFPMLAAATGSRFRVLPPELMPALNNWRPPTGPAQ